MRVSPHVVMLMLACAHCLCLLSAMESTSKDEGLLLSYAVSY